MDSEIYHEIIILSHFPNGDVGNVKRNNIPIDHVIQKANRVPFGRRADINSSEMNI
jgi:hypothetical protein